jgi:exonuclease SbcD
MRVLHTADWHLGKQLHGASFIEDQAFVLDEFIQVVLKEDPDCVIIAGDIYDRSIPPTEAVTLLDNTLTRLVQEYQKPVVVIAGNHDSSDRLGFASAPLARSGLYVFGKYDPLSTPIMLSDQYGSVAICPVPYLEPAVAREMLGSQEIRSHEDALIAACESFVENHGVGRKNGVRSILIAHAFVAGGSECDSERPLSIGGSAVVPAAVFNEFHYVALGHLHRPQTILKGDANEVTVRYSGSLLKYSFSEVSHRKSHTLLEIDQKGVVSFQEIPICSRRDLREVKGSLQELLEAKDAGCTDDYLVVELTNKEAIIDAMGRLREVYPNILHMRKPHLEVRSSNSGIAATRKKGDVEIFSEFFQHVLQEDLTQEQESYLRVTLDEISNQAREQ